MASSGNEVEMVRPEEETNYQHMVLDPSGPISRRIEERETAVSTKMTFTFDHNALTDVMFVDVNPVSQGDCVEVIDVGEQLGFPGQMQARINRDKEIFYGLTIQNFSGLKRTLKWRYRMFSIQRALRFLVLTLLAGLRIDQSTGHHHQRPALCR